MGSSKRKRQSTDSAIADMSSEDSFIQGSTQTSSQWASMSSASTSPEEENKSKRRKQSWTFDARDFGTAASQRPRRGASRPPTEAVGPQSLPQKSRRDVIGDAATGVPQAAPDKVNGNNEKRRQTPRRKQAQAALPTPPQTAEKSETQKLSQSQASVRRSTRERRPTERSHQVSIEQESPCKQKTRGIASSVTSDRAEGTPETNKQKSRIGRLRLRSSSAQPGDSQMSFTGSFSHRQKSSQEQDSQALRDLVRLGGVLWIGTEVTDMR